MYLCKTNKKKMPRILSIDYGQKRTGIAVTDEMKIIASVNNLKAQAAIAFLKDYFSKKEAAVDWGTHQDEWTLRKCIYS
jgi:hypothetical protein